MADPQIWALNSKRAWPKINYEKAIWIPLPGSFNGSMTREEWAQGYAGLWWKASGFRYGQRQIRNLGKTLLLMQEGIYETQPCHTALLHLPNVDWLPPLPVMVACWESVRGRDEQLRTLVHAGEPLAVNPPLVEEFTTVNLGTGLKCQYLQRSRLGPEPDGILNYAWRVDGWETDVRVFTSTPELSRLQRSVPDIDELVRGISLQPLPGG